MKGIVALLMLILFMGFVLVETVMVINWLLYFTGQFGTGFLGTAYATGYDNLSGETGIETASAWHIGCSLWKSRGCSPEDDTDSIRIRGFDADRDGYDDTLADACRLYYGYSDRESCWQRCCNALQR